MIYNEPFLIDIVIESKKSPRSHAALLMLNLSCIFNWNDANCIKWPPDKLEMGSAKPQRGDQDKCEIPQSLWHLDNYSGWVCILNPDECRWFRMFLTSRYQGIVKSTVFGVFEGLKFKISEGYKQNWSCPGSALLAVSGYQIKKCQNLTVWSHFWQPGVFKMV